MSRKPYTFTTKNMGDAEIRVSGEYHGASAKDFDVMVGGGELERSFEETDDGDEIIQWMLENGVQFESDRSMCFNARYISSVMAIGDRTEEELLDEAARWTDEHVKKEADYLRA